MKNYLNKLLKDAPRGGVWVAHVSHDTWCPRLNGGDDCTCNPDVEYTPADDITAFVASVRDASHRPD
jgi:hypothetical protein